MEPTAILSRTNNVLKTMKCENSVNALKLEMYEYDVIFSDFDILFRCNDVKLGLTDDLTSVRLMDLN